MEKEKTEYKITLFIIMAVILLLIISILFLAINNRSGSIIDMLLGYLS